MSEFMHHPDGFIFVRAPGVTYGDTIANFALDAVSAGLAPLPPLPQGTSSRRYIPEQVHALSDGANQSGGEMPWAYGDAAITALTFLLDAKTAREGGAA